MVHVLTSDVEYLRPNLGERSIQIATSEAEEANRRFYRRFSYMERACRQRGLDLGKLSFAEKNALWEEAKAAVADSTG